MTEATNNSRPTLVPPVCPFGPFLLPRTRPYVVESVESTNNSHLALKQGVARATVRMHRVMVERTDREREWEQPRREIDRKESEIRERRTRERIEREKEEIRRAGSWRQQQEAVPGPWCACRNYKVTKIRQQGCIFCIYP